MKIAALAVIVGATLIAGGRDAAAEVNYPWCIITGGASEGAMSCGYHSLAQCQQTRITTDMCVPNPRYQAGPASSPRERSRQ